MGVNRAPSALIVEDERALRLLCRVNLELDGFVVREAETLAEAREALAAATPDVVLLDLRLGTERGELLLEQLRAYDIPVIVVTGLATADDLAGQADAVLTKPFTPEALVETARRVARVEP